MEKCLFRCIVSLILIGLLVGCRHSTKYTPQYKNKAHLVITNNQMAVVKNGETEQLLRSNIEDFFACNKTASQTIGESISKGKSAVALATVSGVMIWFGVLPYIIMYSAANKAYSDGQAKLIDAINLHNDAKSCVPSVKQALELTETSGQTSTPSQVHKTSKDDHSNRGSASLITAKSAGSVETKPKGGD